MTAAAKDLDLSVLSSDYRAAFEAQAARVAELEEINKRQAHLIAQMQQVLYGKKSEKLHKDERQRVFEDLQIAQAEIEEQKNGAQSGDGRPKRKKLAKRNRGNLSKDLPRIEQVIDPDSLECPCGCGEMHKIGEDRTERLDIVPAQLRVIVTVRPKYACRSCSEGVSQAPAPAHLIAGGLPSEGAIAHVLVAKYADHSHCTARARSLPARASISIAPPWPTGWALLPSTSGPWSIGWPSI